MNLIELSNLCVRFPVEGNALQAVRGVSLSIQKGEVLGLVGESGSGKSALCLSLMGLLPKNLAQTTWDTYVFDGQDMKGLTQPQWRGIRGRRIALIPQDPLSALNPYLTVGKQLMEPLKLHFNLTGKQARTRVIEMLRSVGVVPEARRFEQYPHEFSGGMRQRVMIAMALIAQPQLIIADEPTTALDLTVQGQILELLQERCKESATAILLVTHDLGLVAQFCDRVGVMYAGKVIETGPGQTVFKHPQHPYTEALKRSLPGTHRRGEPLYNIPGILPDLRNPPKGCPFAARCAYVQDRCREDPMPLSSIKGESCRKSACWRVLEGTLTL